MELLRTSRFLLWRHAGPILIVLILDFTASSYIPSHSTTNYYSWSKYIIIRHKPTNASLVPELFVLLPAPLLSCVKELSRERKHTGAQAFSMQTQWGKLPKTTATISQNMHCISVQFRYSPYGRMCSRGAPRFKAIQLLLCRLPLVPSYRKP